MSDRLQPNLILTDNMIEAEDLSQILEELGHGHSLIERSGKAGIAAMDQTGGGWNLVVFGLPDADPYLEECTAKARSLDLACLFIDGAGGDWRPDGVAALNRPYIPEDVEAVLSHLGNRFKTYRAKPAPEERQRPARQQPSLWGSFSPDP